MGNMTVDRAKRPLKMVEKPGKCLYNKKHKSQFDFVFPAKEKAFISLPKQRGVPAAAGTPESTLVTGQLYACGEAKGDWEK